MFPLGLALVPGMALPLRIFEDRYLQMYADVIDGEREFGVVLIERGIESRDDNPTFDLGCTAYIIGSGLNDDGTLALFAVGRNRIKVSQWLRPDPYPMAVVEDLSDDELTPIGMRSLGAAKDRLRGLLAMAAELDPDTSSEAPELSPEPMEALYQLALICGLQPLDLQHVLAAETSDDRAALVAEMIDETASTIEMQLEID